jgi:hypothetical protein
VQKLEPSGEIEPDGARLCSRQNSGVPVFSPVGRKGVNRIPCVHGGALGFFSIESQKPS